MSAITKIQAKKITQFETKQTPTIQQEKNIIKKDNIGTVVPGDALRNINLSTIPDIIQDAINKAILDAKTQTLADSLISTMRQTIENFEDGIYTKSYIDTTISYLEELLTQKVSPEIVASIAEAKIAVATSELATTSQVGIISSRLENSETEIINIKETINTKDTARATQIEELQASINQSLSNYSDAIELTIDNEGNVKSQKIESLLSQNASAIISIDENNKITLDENGNFTAYVSKFISDNNGNIVGFSFTDSDDAQSAFGINADVFKIADSENRYTPFRIENGNIYFNGKVSFTNTTTSTGATLTDVLDDLQNNLTNLLNENNTAALLEIANLDEKIDTKEQELINSINAEVQNRIDEIASLVQEDANLDGKITQAEQNRIDAINAVSSAYKNYTTVVTKAMADGVLTAEEQELIADALSAVNLAKARFESLEDEISSLSSSIAAVNTTLSSNAISIANLDEKIDTKEQELINSINAEASTRAAQITARINAEALLDGKIDAEETARINAATALETALKNYTDVVAAALIDGEISAAEQNAINEAQIRVNTAKTQLVTMINNLTKVEDINWQQQVQSAIDNNATTIDGGKITTASILSHQIEANAIAGKNITGGTIRGTQIIGSVIKGSFIDLTTTLALTNWQYFTPSNVPSEYAGNFAHYNTGGITVDSEGYVRLPGQQNFIIPSLVQSGTLYNGSLSNVATTRSETINKIWDLYSWDSYNVNTLQRSIRNNTQFSSNSSLVFKGSISCVSNFGGSGTDVNNYGTYSFRFLNTDIVVSIQASNGNQHNAEITNVIFNGSTVAYADGRFGESTGSDSAFIDYSTTIKGIPINIKTTFTGMAGYTFIFTATINNGTIIPGHTVGDVIRVNSVSHSLNTANSSVAGQTTATYEINFPSTWVV